MKSKKINLTTKNSKVLCKRTQRRYTILVSFKANVQCIVNNSILFSITSFFSYWTFDLNNSKILN
jgi:hypothetical protein